VENWTLKQVGAYPLEALKAFGYTICMSTKAPTLRQFQDAFPTEEACLDHLFQVRYGNDFECPGCARSAKFHRITTRRAYNCQWCGYQVYPTAGTPMDRTRTSLRDWFYVMFLFTTARNGVAAKRVEREIGVTYKTAWRMCHEIREYMGKLDSDDPLGGPGSGVEVDETLIGGSVSGMGSGYKGNKTCVVGMLERGGELVTRVAGRRTKAAMQGLIVSHILPGTTLHTDESGVTRTSLRAASGTSPSTTLAVNMPSPAALASIRSKASGRC
jgi:transposase